MGSARMKFLFSAFSGLLFVALPLAGQKAEPLDPIPDGFAVRILQSNNAGNVHSVIDPVTNTVVARLEGCPRAHNIFAHPDGTYYYCTNETDATLDVWDTRTLEMVERIKLTARPNKASYNKVNHRIYVGISGAPFVDVIDMDTHELLESIRVPTGIHNTYVSLDGKWVVAGLNSRDEGSIQVIDASTNKIVRELTIQHPDGTILGIRPGAFVNGPDGSVSKFLAQVDNFNGTFVLDWETGVTERVLLPPELPAWLRSAEANQGAPTHGLEVLPDGSAFWVSSRLDSRIYGWTLPDYEYIGSVEVGPAANWLTPTPDSKRVYVAVSGADYTVAVDLERLEVIGKMTVGAGPKRVDTAVLPVARLELATQEAQR